MPITNIAHKQENAEEQFSRHDRLTDVITKNAKQIFSPLGLILAMIAESIKTKSTTMWIFVSQRGTEKVIEEDYVSTYLSNTMPDKKPQELGAFIRKLQKSVDGFLTLQGKIQWIEENA